MIKNFIYLDEPKLYSFSSQLFKGITEYVLNEHSIDESNQQQSKEKILSSKTIADVIRETSKSSEKKFLHDHAFNLFESELIESEKLIYCESENVTIEGLSEELKNKSFIKIKAKAKFIDSQYLVDIFKNFSELGESFAIIDLFEEMLTEEIKILSEADKSKKSKLLTAYEKNLQLAIYASMFENDSYLPKRFLEAFTHVLDFSYKGNLYFFQERGNVLFSTLINRDNLRNNITDLIHKYGRATEKEFTVLGVVSHGFKSEVVTPMNNEDIAPESSLKERMANLSEHIIVLESKTSGKQEREIIIDPIAIYTEL
ncbi:hypothetical protein Q6U54_000722 [Vibrio vulnificus]|nr:hypothetical protein [Vibrio vulnificus]HDY7815734.1 hypothetical protein [Vibrio vulnificus]